MQTCALNRPRIRVIEISDYLAGKNKLNFFVQSDQSG